MKFDFEVFRFCCCNELIVRCVPLLHDSYYCHSQWPSRHYGFQILLFCLTCIQCSSTFISRVDSLRAPITILIVNVIAGLRIDSKFSSSSLTAPPTSSFLNLFHFLVIHWNDIHFLWLHIYISYRLNRHTVCFADLIVVDYQWLFTFTLKDGTSSIEVP